MNSTIGFYLVLGISIFFISCSSNSVESNFIIDIDYYGSGNVEEFLLITDNASNTLFMESNFRLDTTLIFEKSELEFIDIHFGNIRQNRLSINTYRQIDSDFELFNYQPSGFCSNETLIEQLADTYSPAVTITNLPTYESIIVGTGRMSLSTTNNIVSIDCGPTKYRRFNLTVELSNGDNYSFIFDRNDSEYIDSLDKYLIELDFSDLVNSKLNKVGLSHEDDWFVYLTTRNEEEKLGIDLRGYKECNASELNISLDPEFRSEYKLEFSNSVRFKPGTTESYKQFEYFHFDQDLPHTILFNELDESIVSNQKLYSFDHNSNSVYDMAIKRYFHNRGFPYLSWNIYLYTDTNGNFEKPTFPDNVEQYLSSLDSIYSSYSLIKFDDNLNLNEYKGKRPKDLLDCESHSISNSIPLIFMQ